MKKLYNKIMGILGRIAALNVPLYASQASFFLAFRQLHLASTTQPLRRQEQTCSDCTMLLTRNL